MEITLFRTEMNGATPGEMWLMEKTALPELQKSRLLALTLEDQVRPAGEFVPNVTAILYGRYRLIITFSQRFKRRMVQVVNDKGSTILFGPHSTDAAGIRLHGGNTDADSEGCILCGANRNANGYDIFNCKDTVDALIALVDKATQSEVVYLNIVKAAA